VLQGEESTEGKGCKGQPKKEGKGKEKREEKADRDTNLLLAMKRG
jgi:hypothetical protein